MTESFDWSTALWPKGIELLGYPRRHPAAMEGTLHRLAEHVEGDWGGGGNRGSGGNRDGG